MSAQKRICKSFAVGALAALPLLGCRADSGPAGQADTAKKGQIVQAIQATLEDGSFEGQSGRTVSPPWVAEGSAGIDRLQDLGRRFAVHGDNNAFVRMNTQERELKWNAIRQSIFLCKGAFYRLTASIRTSPNFKQGWLGFRGFRDAAGWHPQRAVSDIGFGPLPAYVKVNVGFRPPEDNEYNVFAGFWGSDSSVWMQVDDVTLKFQSGECPTPAENPAAP
jgi:hypothetical protein